MLQPSRYFEKPETSTEEMIIEWMASQTDANERMKNQVVELERRINHGLRNHQAIIKNLERQFESLNEKIQPTVLLPRSTNTKPRHEFVYKPPSIRNENDKDAVLLKHVGYEEFESISGVGNGVLTKKKIKKNDNGVLNEPNKEWNLNE
ncbi:hypothetical protein Tco_0839794, partial [Tanacetum coccineum]